ncbi:MAG: hypothetical protein M3Q49_03625 [Actinomycetota bacterium]|nr:hypothetical protein [Actinomycetota bacterium]
MRTPAGDDGQRIRLGEPRTTPQAFSRKWADTELKERAGAQEHFIDVCALVGAPTPAQADKKGEWFAFEKGVEKTSGGKGFADAWYRGHIAFEYKGKHKDLKTAYNQLLLYREDLENPPLLVVTDTERFDVHTNFTGTVKKVYSFANAELPREENLRVLRALFANPDALKPGTTTRSVTEEAAGKFAVVADGLRSRGHDPHRAAHFLNRLLFFALALRGTRAGAGPRLRQAAQPSTSDTTSQENTTRFATRPLPLRRVWCCR